MSKEFLLFEKEEINYTTKFMKLQDLLVTNKSTSRFECIILFTIFYIQTISGFFAANLGVLDIKNSSSDGYLNYFNKMLRIKDLFLEDYDSFQIVLVIILLFMIISTIYYFYVLSKIEKDSIYTLREQILNVILKLFLFVFFKPILDFSLANVCFDDTNPNFSNVSCVVADNPGTFAIGVFLFFYSSFLSFFINLFYNDSQFLLQNAYFSRMNCGYEMYITLNHIIYAVLLSQGTYLGKELFIVYNLFVSVLLLKFYFEKYLFYDSTINMIAGVFHTVYAWSSGYFFIFNFIEISEKGVIYVLGMLIICYLYYNLKEKLEDYIFLNVPFHKLTNKYHILFYIKTLMQKINNIDSNLEDKAKMIGIIQTHIMECPQADCETKNKSKKIYLPLAEEWTERDKPEISDRVFLLNFLIMVMNFYIKENNYSADFMINRSLYYLNVIGNNCQAMLYYNKVKEMNLTLQERFALLRVYYQISKSLVSKLKSSREGCLILDDLNVTLYFKYEDLSQKFFDEINNDISLSLEFWKNLKQHHETSRVIDFNRIFELTDKIRLSKSKIEKIWSDIFNTYSGVNDLFDLYENYIEQINDDDLQKRELDSLKNKNVLSSEHIQVNYYNLLFNKNTGIIIANGHKYKEGIIEKANDEIERIFEYKADELKGMNVTRMIPRAVAKNHRLFMERFYEIGEKRVLDRQLRTYAKDKENCIIPVQLYVKLFPMLADYAYFCGLIFKENLDDIIIVDKKFNIQCCSRKLMEKMELSNKLMFQDYDIPFYIICKKFVNFFKVFLKRHKQKDIDTSQINYNDHFNKENEEEIEDYEINENVEVSENTELEYELRVPQFLLDYSASPSSKKDNTMDFTMDKSLDATNNENSFFNMNNTNNVTQIADEEENLVEDDNHHKSKGDKKTPDKANNAKIKGQPTELDKNNKKSNFGLDKQQDEEREFHNKINHFRNLFEYGKFQDLEELIEKHSKNSFNKEYKFNFSFQPYYFGDKETLYIIRCIDNKSEFEDGGSSGDVDNNNNLEPYNNNVNVFNKNPINKLKSIQEIIHDENSNKNFTQNHLRQKQMALKRLSEATQEERLEMLEKSQNFLKMSEDKNFIKTQYHFIEEIASFSKIFGQKKDDQCTIIVDETGSQSSSAGFNDSLSKKSRVEEIRGNIMKNISNFYTLKYIKTIFLLTFLITVAFCVLYLIIFDYIYTDLIKISDLNITLFQSTIWMSNVISTLVSMRYVFNYTLIDYPIKYNSYKPNKIEYFEELRKNSFKWYKNIITNFGTIEKNIHYYYDSDSGGFWNDIPISYPDSGLKENDFETFPLSLAQVLTENNELLKNEYFSIEYLTNLKKNGKRPKGKFNDTDGNNNLNANKSNTNNQTTHDEDNDNNNNPSIFDEIEQMKIEFSGFLSIENSINNLLPKMLSLLSSVPSEFQDYNTSNMKFIILIKIVYGFTLLLFMFIYSIFLYLTNKNMQEGLEKVCRIKLPSIDETIKRIEQFNERCLSKYRQRDQKSISDEPADQSENQSENNNSDKFRNFGEGAKYKSLKILTYSYIEVLIVLVIICSILIPIYFISLGMINDSNKILSVQNYIFGKSLTASASTVFIKCMISVCKTDKDLNYKIDFVDRTQIENIIRDITYFTELSQFYNNKFLLNACLVLHNDTSTAEYNACMADKVIQSANNTDSLLKLVEETVSTIAKDKDMKIGKAYLFGNNETVAFTNPLLFETNYFRDLEFVFYNFITPISDNFASVVSNSLNNYLLDRRQIIIILICIFGLIILMFSAYIAFVFTNKLIHLLSVSRCIFRIIPTNVINNTNELETWLENKY